MQLEAGAAFARGRAESSETIARSRAAPFAGLSLELAFKVRIGPRVSAEIAASAGGALGGLGINVDDVDFGRLGGWMAGARSGLRFEL